MTGVTHPRGNNKRGDLPEPNTMLTPSLTKLNSTKRKRLRVIEPCTEGLKYDENEVILLNDNGRKLSGSSSRFKKTKSDIIPLEAPFPSSRDDYFKISFDGWLDVDLSFQSVIQELYGKPTSAPDPKTPVEKREGQAFRTTRDHNYQPQYYLQNVTQEVKVIHFITDGKFWDTGRLSDEKNLNKFDEGDLAYTHGFVWCNTNPKWSWGGNNPSVVRCTIILPKHTQVVVDRGPTSGLGNMCQFDENNTSLYPDVLLPPGEFEILSAEYYRTKNADYSSDDDHMDCQDAEANVSVHHVMGKSEQLVDVILRPTTKMFHLIDPQTLPPNTIFRCGKIN